MEQHILREYARKRLTDEVFSGKPTKAKNAETAIFNWSVERTKDPSWDNRYFKETYKHRLLSVLFNLKKNPEILTKIKAQDLERFSSAQMWPNGPFGQMDIELMKKSIKLDLAKVQLDNIEGILVCPKCKTKKTSYYQMQTRSADEPMTTFAQCLCGHKWKFC